MLTEITLKTNFGRLNIDYKVSVQVCLIVPYPTLLQVDLSDIVTREGALCDWTLVKMVGLLVMWFEAHESITHLFEEVIRHVLSNPVKVLTEVDSFNDIERIQQPLYQKSKSYYYTFEFPDYSQSYS